MRVLWIDLVSELGGAQYSLLEVCTGLAGAGIEVLAAVPSGPLREKLMQAGIETYPVAELRATRRGFGLFTTTARLMKAPATIRQIVKTVKPDIIHANSLTALLAAQKTGSAAAMVWHVRDLRMPMPLARVAAPKAHLIIAISEAVDETLSGILAPHLLGRIRVLQNGIPLPPPADAARREAARKVLGLPLEEVVIGMVAHLIPWKRQDAFIAAAALIHARLPQARFVIVGRDLFQEHAQWIERLRVMAQQHGLADNLRWIDNQDDAARMMPAFDLLLHPALGEPFGRAICEAMAAGVPVVAAASGGPASIIEDEVSGRLIRHGDPQAMGMAALELLEDPARAQAMGIAARRRIIENFTVDKLCGELAAEYQRILKDIAISKRKGE